MAGTHGNENEFIKHILEQKSYLEYELFALLRAIERLSPLYPGLGCSKTPRDDPVRLGQSPLLAFFPSAISEIKKHPDKHLYKIKNSYWGLFGCNGPLPTHLSEYALQRKIAKKDATLCEFADIFHHRLLSLYYRAWKTGQASLHFDKSTNNEFHKHISALSRNKSFEQQKQSTALLYCGLLTNKNTSLAVIEQILAHQLAVTTKLLPLQGQWLQIDAKDLSLLGKSNSHLGKSAINGRHVFDRLNKICLCLSRLSLRQYLSFLPREAGHRELRSLVNLLVPEEMTIEVQLTLRPGHATSSHLKNNTHLGFNSWLGNQSCWITTMAGQQKSYLLQRESP
ncbi:type VI secretion system baseplate subunit TssG [Thalassomonas actiniarum]|uniref:Type VI secretion system baseplate subunit TssG n=1 Tax=Thalassomonas actiniarum TaxID=485447 RepID=A0AAE9YW41_9GAMM|nr:type VI secretion system baseplate subunit TssG [Thalassomonas actiniarum]WDE01445.1 type VI secretion system baseplate subunit TssG [Thalassomonas actiniarum]